MTAVGLDDDIVIVTNGVTDADCTWQSGAEISPAPPSQVGGLWRPLCAGRHVNNPRLIMVTRRCSDSTVGAETLHRPQNGAHAPENGAYRRSNQTREIRDGEAMDEISLN